MIVEHSFGLIFLYGRGQTSGVDSATHYYKQTDMQLEDEANDLS